MINTSITDLPTTNLPITEYQLPTHRSLPIMLTDTTTQQYADLFRQHVLRYVRFWGDHDAVTTVDVPTLEPQRDNILKVMSLALDMPETWSLLRPLLIAFAPFMERRGYWDLWNRILQRAIAAAQKVADLDGEITLTALLARLYQRRSRPTETIYHYRRVIQLARKTDNRFEEARACSNLGYLFIDEGHWWRSEVLSRHALAVFEELRSEHG
ncbi:tetratricopeptide repeat protein, partial [Chloroflexi bacterium TSY]|nr:tetratricopeptide repeat protein [Chloroflexi bacterium TSY]